MLLWVLCLAALAVGARNFEAGLALDAPVYSTVARNIARTGDWFRMDCQIPDFIPFAEHPHLGFWMMALWMKVAPAQDWAVRIPGHLMYVVFLTLLFFYVRRKSSERIAIWTIVLLWSFHLFSNIFSTFYLDPGVLLLGTASLWAFEASLAGRWWWASVGGFSLGLAVLYKGLTILGLGPVFLFLLAQAIYEKRDGKAVSLRIFSFLLPALAVVLAYVWAISRSSLPEFLDIYFARQVTNRFARKWSFLALFRADYWWQLWNYSNFLLPLALLTLPKIKQKPYLLFPWIYAGSFIFMFATSGLTGGQYLIMILPWVAWLIAEGVLYRVPIAERKLVVGTAALSLAALFLLQYIPVRTHGRGVLPEYEMLARLSSEGKVQTLHLMLPPFPSPFVLAAPYAWYADVRVQYPPEKLEDTPVAKVGEAYFLRVETKERIRALESRGWCLRPGGEDGSLFLPCP